MADQWFIPMQLTVFFFIFVAIFDDLGGEALLPSTNTLSWNPPTTYQVEKTLNPADDHHSFEIYIKKSGYFSETDIGMGVDSEINRGTGQVSTFFHLAILPPFVKKGNNDCFSVHAVGKNVQKSGISNCVTCSN